MLIKVDEDKQPEELKKLYRMYGVEFEDTLRVEDCDEVVIKHIEQVERVV